MADMVTHRLAEVKCDHDFASQLASGDALSGSPSVVFTRRVGDDYVDVSSEFPNINPSRSGTKVLYWKRAAAQDAHQNADDYHVRISCPTVSGEILVAEVRDGQSLLERRVPILTLIEGADPSAVVP